MINKVFPDFVKTWGKGMLLSIEPKMTRAERDNPKSPQVQGTDGNGLLRWTATVAVPIQGFDKIKQENIEITVNAPQRPYAAMIGHYVIAEGLEMGIMATKTGYSVFFSAENIKPAPPERPTAGQEAGRGGNS